MSQSIEFVELVTEVRACRLCEPYLPLGARPVLHIHPDAKILIASQAPGRKVHETGISFNDASGDRLRSWLGIDRATFYDEHKIAIIPMGLCYPGKGKSGDLPPRPECAPKWRKPLLAQLPNLELTLAIGQYALKYHLGSEFKSVADSVERWQEFYPSLIPLPHPSPRNILWLKRRPWFENELLPIVRERVHTILASSA